MTVTTAAGRNYLNTDYRFRSWLFGSVGEVKQAIDCPVALVVSLPPGGASHGRDNVRA